MISKSLRETILYEIAMIVGNSLNLEQSLRDFCIVLLRKLSARSVVIFEKRGDIFSIVYSLPKTAIFDGGITKYLTDDLLFEIEDNGKFIYGYRLDNFGCLIIEKSSPLERELAYMLQPIMKKFAISVQSCKLYEDAKNNMMRAQKAEKIKMQFLANMSHEIRTPLNGIIGFIDLLVQDDSINKNSKRMIHTIKQSSEMLLSIVNDILDIAKIEEQGVSIEAKRFNPLFDFIDTLELFKAKALEKNLDYAIFIDPKLPVEVYGDYFRIKQVLSNLIGNAIKFTQKGEVFCEISLKNLTKDECEIFFSVKDSGIGIPKEKQKRVFEMFSQADDSINRKFGGTGLGLAISSKIVEALGGKLELESKVGDGSRFFFTLKFKISSLTNRIKDTINDMNFLFLYSEDSSKNLNIVEKVITNIGHVDKISIDEFLKVDLDIYDIIFTTSKTLKVCNIDKDKIPIVVVDKEVEGCYFLNTPYNVYELFSILHKVAGESLEHTKESGSEDIVSFDGKVLVVDDQDINRELMSILLDKFGLQDVVFARDGNEAIEKFKKDKPELVFMDINMPVLSGVGALKNIRVFDKKIPIVALTANAMSGDKKRYLKLGFSDYLAKPFKQSELKAILSKFLKQKSKAVKKPDKMGGIIEKLRVKYLKDLPNEMDSLKSAIEQKNLEEVRAISHKIKGTSANLRLNDISDIAKKIEQKSADGDWDVMTLFEELKSEVSKIQS